MNRTRTFRRSTRFMGCLGLAASVACGGASVARPTQPTEGASALGASQPPGEFDASVVSARVRSQSAQIKRCYERELARDRTLRGTIRVDFIIRTSGAVTDVILTENSVSPEVGSCVRELIASMHFSPGPSGGFVRYRFPFVFEPGR